MGLVREHTPAPAEPAVAALSERIPGRGPVLTDFAAVVGAVGQREAY